MRKKKVTPTYVCHDPAFVSTDGLYRLHAPDENFWNKRERERTFEDKKRGIVRKITITIGQPMGGFEARLLALYCARAAIERNGLKTASLLGRTVEADASDDREVEELETPRGAASAIIRREASIAALAAQMFAENDQPALYFSVGIAEMLRAVNLDDGTNERNRLKRANFRIAALGVEEVNETILVDAAGKPAIDRAGKVRVQRDTTTGGAIGVHLREGVPGQVDRMTVVVNPSFVRSLFSEAQFVRLDLNEMALLSDQAVLVYFGLCAHVWTAPRSKAGKEAQAPKARRFHVEDIADFAWPRETDESVDRRTTYSRRARARELIEEIGKKLKPGWAVERVGDDEYEVSRAVNRQTRPVIGQTDPVIGQTNPVIHQTNPVIGQTDLVNRQTAP